MLPEPEKEVVTPNKSIGNLLANTFSAFTDKVLPSNNSQHNSEKEINRVIIRQFSEREDIQKFLKEAESYFFAPAWVLALVMFAVGLLVAVITKSVVLGSVGLVLGLFVAIIVNSIRLSSHPTRFYEKVKEISGGEDHLRVLEGMLKNTGFALKKSTNNTGSEWFLEELKNFIKKDKEALTQEVINANNASLKTEVLRNINIKD